MLRIAENLAFLIVSAFGVRKDNGAVSVFKEKSCVMAGFAR